MRTFLQDTCNIRSDITGFRAPGFAHSPKLREVSKQTPAAPSRTVRLQPNRPSCQQCLIDCRWADAPAGRRCAAV